MTTLCIDELSRRLKTCWGWSCADDHVLPALPDAGEGLRVREAEVYIASSHDPSSCDVRCPAQFRDSPASPAREATAAAATPVDLRVPAVDCRDDGRRR